MKFEQAPELQTIYWFNTERPLTLEGLRDRVVLIEAFQMLCPGCVSNGLPQAQRVAETFSSDDVCVLGLHTVFEHHAAQGSMEALEAFLHEYRITFPVGMDLPSSTANVPKTMAAYRMQGTPTSILIDRDGYLRSQHFGRVDDMSLGAEIMALIKQSTGLDSQQRLEEPVADDHDCDESGCVARSEHN